MNSMKPHDRDCLLKVSTAATSFLLAGKIQNEAEELLVNSPQIKSRLQSKALLVPNHGSKTSSFTGFINAVNPERAFITNAYGHRWHYPNDNIVQRYQLRGIQLMTTAADGAVIWDSTQMPQAYRRERLAIGLW